MLMVGPRTASATVCAERPSAFISFCADHDGPSVRLSPFPWNRPGT